MGARRLSIILLLLLAPAPAWAHRHQKAFYTGYSDVRSSSLDGIELSFELMLPKDDPTPAPPPFRFKTTSRWSLFEDVSVNWGSHDGNDRRQVALTLGGRYQIPLEKSRLEPFVHVNLAFVHTQDSPTVSDWASGGGAGAGLRYDFEYWCIRAQVDYVRLWWSGKIAKDYFRPGVGVEIRWGRNPRPGKH